MEYFDFVKKVNYEGEQVQIRLLSSSMIPTSGFWQKDERAFAVPKAAWWHNLGAAGADMFGVGTADKSSGAIPGTMERTGGQRWTRALSSCKSSESNVYPTCFHDVDLVPEDKDINVYKRAS